MSVNGGKNLYEFYEYKSRGAWKLNGKMKEYKYMPCNPCLQVTRVVVQNEVITTEENFLNVLHAAGARMNISLFEY